jgi:hypothetical protein
LWECARRVDVPDSSYVRTGPAECAKLPLVDCCDDRVEGISGESIVFDMLAISVVS